MGVRPDRPVEINGATRRDGIRIYLSVGGIDRADDVLAIDIATIDGPCVVVPGWPADSALIWGPWRYSGIEPGVVAASDSPQVNPTMS